jgi:transcriptional regulator with XRE-family HTH domain
MTNTDSRIGAKMTTLRESLGLSTADLAERSGCDAATIERLESGEAAPSLAPLIRLTRAMGVRLGTLLDDETELGPIVTRRDEAEQVQRVRSLETAGDAGVLGFFSLASGKASRHMEPFLIDVEPADTGEHKLSSHEGEEFLFVLDGAIEVEYGKERHVLQTGDSIYYDSIVPHQVRAAGVAPAKILAVVYAPA